MVRSTMWRGASGNDVPALDFLQSGLEPGSFVAYECGWDCQEFRV